MLHYFLEFAFRELTRSIRDITRYLQTITKEITKRFNKIDDRFSEVELQMNEMNQRFEYLRHDLEDFAREAEMFAMNAMDSVHELASTFRVYYGVYCIDKETRKGYFGVNLNQIPTFEDGFIYLVPVENADPLGKSGTQEWKLPEGNSGEIAIADNTFDPNNPPATAVKIDSKTDMLYKELSLSNHLFYQEAIIFEGEEEITLDMDNTKFKVDVFYVDLDDNGELKVKEFERKNLQHYQINFS